MRRQRTDGVLGEFQEIHSLNEGDFYSKDREGHLRYKGIRVDFLECLFGEDWLEVFLNIYDIDIRQFYRDYGSEYKDWNYIL